MGIGFDMTVVDGEVHMIKRQGSSTVQTFCGDWVHWSTSFHGEPICGECAETTGYEDYEEICQWR